MYTTTMYDDNNKYSICRSWYVDVLLSLSIYIRGREYIGRKACAHDVERGMIDKEDRFSILKYAM